MKDEAFRLALEEIRTKSVCQTARTIAKDALRKALEQPDPEPVAWGVDWGNAGDSPCVSIIKRLPDGGIEVVAVEYGPKREWQGLTDEQKVALCKQFPDHLTFNAIHAIEAKLKEKNDVS